MVTKTNIIGDLPAPKYTNEYKFRAEDEIWLDAAVKYYPEMEDSPGKASGTDRNNTNKALLKELWKIGYSYGLNPAEFVNETVTRTSLIFREGSRELFLHKQKQEAYNIAKVNQDKKNSQGYITGFEAKSHQAINSKRYRAIDTIVQQKKQSLASEAATKIAIEEERKRIIEEEKVKQLEITQRKQKDLEAQAPKGQKIELDPDNLVKGAVLNIDSFTVPVSDKATWIKIFIDILKRDPITKQYATPVGAKIQAYQENLNPKKLGDLYDIAKKHHLNPKEFLCWLAFNTSFKNNVATEEYGTLDLIKYAQMRADSKYPARAANRTVVEANGMISDYLDSDGPKNLNIATEATALFRSAMNDINKNITIISTETLSEDPISGAKTIRVTCVDDKGLMHIATMEGFRGKPYKCSAGVLTIGYGSTTYIDKDGKEKPIKQGMVVNKDQALGMLAVKMRETEARLRDGYKDLEGLKGISLTQEAFNAIASLAYNVGPRAVLQSRFVKALRARDYAKAEYEFKDFNKIKVNGVPVTVEGLTNRRVAEVKGGLDTLKEHWRKEDEAKKTLIARK